jgi:hypothetical protein
MTPYQSVSLSLLGTRSEGARPLLGGGWSSRAPDPAPAAVRILEDSHETIDETADRFEL